MPLTTSGQCSEAPNRSAQASPEHTPTLAISAQEQDPTPGPPSLERLQAVQAEAREAWIQERRQFTKEVAQKYQEAFQMSIVYFRVHHQDLSRQQVSEMICRFSDLIPNSSCRAWAMTLCNETLLHLIQIYWEKIKEAESLEPAEFCATVQAIGKFGIPLQRYCIEMDPENALWKLAHVATTLVPHTSPGMLLQMLTGFSRLKVFGERFLNEVLLYVEVNLESFTAPALADLVEAFGRLEYDKCSRLVTKLSHVIIPGVSDLSPAQLSKLLFHISGFGWRNAQALTAALLEVWLLPEGISEGPVGDWEANGHYPGDSFVSAFCQDFIQRSSQFNNSTIAVRNLIALAELGCHDAEAISTAKACILKADVPLGHAFLVGWSLSILNAFDEESIKWWVHRVEQTSVSNTTDLQKRHIYQTLMHVYVLQSELGRFLDIDPEFEAVCMEKWRQRIKASRYTSHTTLQVLVTLRELGFYGFREYYTFGRRFCISVFLHKSFPQRICLVCENGFWNLRQRLRGPHLWKQTMLEKLGWLMLKIKSVEWESLKSKSEKREFLRTKLREVLHQRIAAEKGHLRDFLNK